MHVSDVRHTARFVCTTDAEQCQIASFYPGAMSEAREIELGPIADRLGGVDLVLIGANDPEAMTRHTDECRFRGIPFVADPSQQLAWLDGDGIKQLVDGAAYLFSNDYEAALIEQKTGWSRRRGALARRRPRHHARQGRRPGRGRRARPPIEVTCPPEELKADPTGVGDAFRAGFLAGLAWELSHERCAQIGSLLATYVIETVGTQEYDLAQAALPRALRRDLRRRRRGRGRGAHPLPASLTAAPRCSRVTRVEPPPSRWELPDPRARAAAARSCSASVPTSSRARCSRRTARGCSRCASSHGGPLGWWSPDPRGVLPLDGLHVTRSLRRSCRRFATTVDTAFDEVVRGCGDPRAPARVDHRRGRARRTRGCTALGWAHSVETRTPEGDLVGGLYGVEIGGLFAGESMFSHATDASKVALVALVERLAARRAGRGRAAARRAVAHRPPGHARGRRRRRAPTTSPGCARALRPAAGVLTAGGQRSSGSRAQSSVARGSGSRAARRGRRRRWGRSAPRRCRRSTR